VIPFDFGQGRLLAPPEKPLRGMMPVEIGCFPFRPKTCQDPEVDDFCVRHSFGWEYKLAGDDTITPFNLIF
jgi:hypothetical protein